MKSQNLFYLLIKLLIYSYLDFCNGLNKVFGR